MGALKGPVAPGLCLAVPRMAIIRQSSGKAKRLPMSATKFIAAQDPDLYGLGFWPAVYSLTGKYPPTCRLPNYFDNRNFFT